mmetsp:Transcript_33084/g.93638  ORF Transcript_33084/g.93638 Transcript_33084/m.93638 type:complete len:208 (-) Transcript_33084:183-806(-)
MSPGTSGSKDKLCRAAAAWHFMPFPPLPSRMASRVSSNFFSFASCLLWSEKSSKEESACMEERPRLLPLKPSAPGSIWERATRAPASPRMSLLDSTAARDVMVAQHAIGTSSLSAYASSLTSCGHAAFRARAWPSFGVPTANCSSVLSVVRRSSADPFWSMLLMPVSVGFWKDIVFLSFMSSSSLTFSLGSLLMEVRRMSLSGDGVL